MPTRHERVVWKLNVSRPSFRNRAVPQGWWSSHHRSGRPRPSFANFGRRRPNYWRTDGHFQRWDRCPRCWRASDGGSGVYLRSADAPQHRSGGMHKERRQRVRRGGLSYLAPQVRGGRIDSNGGWIQLRAGLILTSLPLRISCPRCGKELWLQSQIYTRSWWRYWDIDHDRIVCHCLPGSFLRYKYTTNANWITNSDRWRRGIWQPQLFSTPLHANQEEHDQTWVQPVGILCNRSPVWNRQFPHYTLGKQPLWTLW